MVRSKNIWHLFHPILVDLGIRIFSAFRGTSQHGVSEGFRLCRGTTRPSIHAGESTKIIKNPCLPRSKVMYCSIWRFPIVSWYPQIIHFSRILEYKASMYPAIGVPPWVNLSEGHPAWKDPWWSDRTPQHCRAEIQGYENPVNIYKIPLCAYIYIYIYTQNIVTCIYIYK